MNKEHQKSLASHQQTEAYTTTTVTVNETQALAKKILNNLKDNKVIFLLSGPMGSGKTQWVREFVNALGGEEISSPSFALHNHYKAGDVDIHHLDLYRLEGEDDLESTGFWDLFSNESGYIIIEWADRLNFAFLPPDWSLCFVDIALNGEQREWRVEHWEPKV